MTHPARNLYIGQAYRNVFSTPEGIAVLTNILANLFHFDRATGEAQQECTNRAKAILTLCGPEMAGKVYMEYEALQHDTNEEETTNG
jgi:hypothetical protein